LEFTVWPENYNGQSSHYNGNSIETSERSEQYSEEKNWDFPRLKNNKRYGNI
jgi:hypothetical protein